MGGEDHRRLTVKMADANTRIAMIAPARRRSMGLFDRFRFSLSEMSSQWSFDGIGEIPTQL